LPIPAPTIKWPAEFIEAGPAEDSTIMLIGEAEIAGVMFRVTALRMRVGMRTPDYQDELSESEYEVDWGGMVEDVEDLVDSMKPQLINIGGTQYLLWMVPSASL
jgi:hypothetical protein